MTSTQKRELLKLINKYRKKEFCTTYKPIKVTDNLTVIHLAYADLLEESDYVVSIFANLDLLAIEYIVDRDTVVYKKYNSFDEFKKEFEDISYESLVQMSKEYLEEVRKEAK